jgi:hypothetical protein
MQFRKLVVKSSLVVLGLGLGLLVGCSKAAPINTTVPNNIASIEAGQPGASLKQFGYTPVTGWYQNHKRVGYVYVACGNETNVSKCGSDLHNKGTMSHPNVYVIQGKVLQLEGPHDSSNDDRSYYLKVPPAWQNFAALTHVQQKQLLGIMPEAAKAYGKPSEAYSQTVDLSIGQVQVILAR